MSSILPSGRAITRKAAFDTWDASITKVSDIVAEFECHSDVLHPLCTPEHTLDGDLSQKLSPSHPGMSLEEAYRHLDEKMVELEKIEQRMMRARRELLGLRNSSLHLVPANKLLPEILSYIFLLGVEQAEYDLDMAESDSESEEGEPALDPIPFNLLVSQVCRRWRTIAINTATLELFWASTLL
ncbi:uncharacterized protein EI90DRAFT_2473315 [Cantharellus anzutake]|uniref:uncharacterized protein n=1 Tax=Cantharellus anzutake TaxID=1750568 RepID=UPI0019060655|nr:uncharacterized protein EI90DRAFT_2473315 [Cantharellus anzutake]KAF8322759.1 hypothetical protein EI90DRAFT_2473315 [Cantharellus anzutake]